ncbi:ribosomal protein S18-alanine N-acetyltransferase [Chloroflexota bacterium]
MPYHVRLMGKEDVTQVTEVDREAFSTQWPPPNYQHELRSRLAHYIVAYDEEKTVEQPEVKTSSEKGLTGWAFGLRRLFSRNRFFSSELPPPNRHYIIGFTGFWIMADEAHITSIAVREAYRRQGVGELLLISVIDLATELKARIITLEVRTSNSVAQSLYTKYGFTRVGMRRGYYADNREDGVFMSTEDINSPAFRARLQQLK